MHPLYERLLRFFVLHAYTHSGSKFYLRVVEDGWVLTLEPVGDAVLVAVFFIPMSTQTFDDSKQVLVPGIGVMSDGSVVKLDPSTFTEAADDATMSIVTVKDPSGKGVPIPGTSLVLNDGDQCWAIPATNAVEDVNVTVSGLPNGVTVPPFAVSDAPPPPPTLVSASFVPLQQ